MARVTNMPAAVLAMALAAPAAASAQDETYTRMSVSATQIYDGNLFATPASRGPQSDLISRVRSGARSGLCVDSPRARRPLRNPGGALSQSCRLERGRGTSGRGDRAALSPDAAARAERRCVVRLRRRRPANSISTASSAWDARPPSASRSVSRLTYDWSDVTTVTCGAHFRKRRDGGRRCQCDASFAGWRQSNAGASEHLPSGLPISPCRLRRWQHRWRRT